MKKYTTKCLALFLAAVMTASSITPVSFAAPKNESENASEEGIVLSDNTKSILEAARAMAAINAIGKEEKEVLSAEKEAVQDGIFHHHEEETDLEAYDITSEEMDEIVEEVLEENHLESTVEVTYETDAEDKVTSMSVEMDALVAMAGEEASGLTAEQREELMGKYSQYMSFMQANADLFGVQTPYFTNKDKMCPLGSLLAIAGIPNQYLSLGLDFIVQNIMSYDEVSGVVDLFHYANVFAVELKKSQIESARNKALKAVSGAKTDIQKHLELTDWLAQNCTFDMPYIMEMQAPQVDTESAMYKDKMNIYNAMYQNIKGQVYDGYYQYLLYMEGYPEETAKQVAEMMAKSYMDDPAQDGSPNGSESAMTLASSIINLWEGSHVGALTYGTAVCLGYSNAYVYLIQNLYTNVYKNRDGSWKTYDQLNNGSNGNWNAIVDYVRITFDAEVTMFGVTQDNFQSDHYWNAVKLDGKWYYVDPCYVDVYVEVMARDRVETNGNVNHLYFMFSDDTARNLYEDYYKELDTLYQGIATDKKYEDAWFAFAKSPIYKNESTYYYMYDSTDMIELQDSNTQFTADDIEYKIVAKSVESSNSGDANANFTTELINFTNGQVYNPSTAEMEDNPLIKKYYDEFRTYKEDYPSLVISVAFYNGKLYFNMSNCIFSYDLETGDVQRLIEYNKVTAARDMTVAFGGMSFTEASSEGDYGVTVKNPPIAGMTIRDGEMTVDIATALGYISGKKSHTDSDDEPEDASSYGYMFEETHYNPEYLYASFSDMGSMMGDTDNDNDEFMWSANIYETVDMAHLTGNHRNYSNVTVDATCTDVSYQEKKCSTCGLIQEAGTQVTTINVAIVDADGNAIEGVTVSDTFTVESTEEDYIATSFKASDIKTAVETALGDEYSVLAVEMPETIAWGETKTANVVVEAVEKATPVTVTVEGAAVTVDAVTVTSTKKNLEAAAEAAAKAAVEAKIAADEYTVASVDATSLEWGTAAAVKVVLQAIEKETKVNVAVKFVDGEGKDVKEPAMTIEPVTLKNKKADDIKAAAIAAAEEAVSKIITDGKNEDAYELQKDQTVADDKLIWGAADGTVTVTLKVIEKENTLNVNVVDGTGKVFEGITVAPVKLTTAKSAYDATVNEAAEAAKEEVVTKLGANADAYTVKAEVTKKTAWGAEEAGIITVTVGEIEKTTKITVETGVEGVEVTGLAVESTKATLSEKAVTALVGKTTEKDGTVYEVEKAEVSGTPVWGDTVNVKATLKVVKKTTPVTVEVTGALDKIEGLDKVSVQTDEDNLTKEAEKAVEKAIAGKVDETIYTVDSIKASDAVWGTGVKVTITVSKIEVSEDNTEGEDTTPEGGEGEDTTPEGGDVVVEGEEAPVALAEGDPVATLNITINGQSEQPEPLTAEGTAGKTHVFTANEIKAAVKGVLGNGNDIAVTTIISDRAVKYGETETITVTLRFKEATHDYVQFKETYYTKNRNNWQTGTCYVCLNCKDVVEDKPEIVRSVNKNNLTKVWTWRSDYSAASLYKIPTELQGIKLDCVWENPSVGSSRQVASSISKVMEGTCDAGVTYVYTATVGSDTDVKRAKQPATPHQYIADEILFAWAEDYSKCDISYKCSFCGKAGTHTCTQDKMIIDYVEPTCLVDGKTIYTATVELEGNVYTDSREIFNDNKALGHEYAYDEAAENELCIRCKQVKPDSKITLPENHRGVYTGKEAEDLTKLYTVEGSQGEITITYYTNKACTKKTTKKDHGAAKEGAAPSQMGIYYAKAAVAADAQYKAAESGVCKFILGPDSVPSLKKSNMAAGVKISWGKVDEATGYEIYRRDPNGAYEKVKTIKNNTTLEWTDEKVTAGETYVYDVRTYAKTGTGTVRCEVNADGVYIVRSEITAGNISSGVKLTWTKIPKATTYKVYRKAVATESKYTLLATVEANKTSYTDKKAKNGVKYYYYVKPDTSGTTHTVAKVFLTKGNLSSVKAPKAKQLTVTWKKNAKADGYRIRYSTSESFKSYKTVLVKSNKTLTATLKSLKKNTKYYVKVQSYKKNSGKTYYSAWSDVKSKKTKK